MAVDIFSDNRSYYHRVNPGYEKDDEIKILEEVEIFRNGYIVFRNDLVSIPGVKEPSPFLRLKTPASDGTVVVAVWPQCDLIAVVKQFRYPAAVWEVALPRGFSNPGDENSIMTGFREFSEEVGGQLHSDRRWSLGRILTDSGKLHDAPHIILAELAFPRSVDFPSNPDATEAIAEQEYRSWVPFHMLQSWVESGKIVDSFTCAAVARLRPHFNECGKFAPREDILAMNHLKNSDSLFI